MTTERDPNVFRGVVDGIPVEVRPEWLAGHYWWRVFIHGANKVLLRHREHAIRAAEVLASDEAELRREQKQG